MPLYASRVALLSAILLHASALYSLLSQVVFIFAKVRKLYFGVNTSE